MRDSSPLAFDHSCGNRTSGLKALWYYIQTKHADRHADLICGPFTSVSVQEGEDAEDLAIALGIARNDARYIYFWCPNATLSLSGWIFCTSIRTGAKTFEVDPQCRLVTPF